MEPLGKTFSGRRVLVTGHTGFKGAWLCEWLLALGAEVHGFSLPATIPLAAQLGLEKRLASERLADLRQPGAVREAVDAADPEFVFHLAAQPLVRLSYDCPAETYDVNVMGTIHVLEALRLRDRPCVAVLVTTDKCYENREWQYGYREDDPLGGHDPYSSSKAAAEIAISAWRRSYFHPAKSPVKLASARAGNVIGGGDWARDRIVPDAVRALAAGRPIEVRNPAATRPWQHVLEPLGGYLSLAAALDGARAAGDGGRLQALCAGFNFGPGLGSNRTVGDLVAEIVRHWPGTWNDASAPGALHEATLLHLSTDRAHHRLGWSPRWDFAETVRRTVAWYRSEAQDGPAGLAALTRQQILDYGAATA